MKLQGEVGPCGRREIAKLLELLELVEKDERLRATVLPESCRCSACEQLVLRTRVEILKWVLGQVESVGDPE